MKSRINTFRPSSLLFLLPSSFLLLSSFSAFCQEAKPTADSLKKPSHELITGTFRTTRIVIGQSAENPPAGNLVFLITHHFGAVNTGYDNLFGLKQATIRLGAEIGIIDRLGVGVGLNTYKNTWDGFLKFRILRQSKGGRNMPFSLSAIAGTSIYTTKWEVPERKNYFTSRMDYTFELILARKFGEYFSLQLMPVLTHKNLVASNADHNDIFSLGAGAKARLSSTVSFDAEYHYLFPHQVVSEKVYNSFSIGIEIETSGHDFQIFLTNSAGEFESAFLTETSGSWSHGNIFLGFNITRFFEIF